MEPDKTGLEQDALQTRADSASPPLRMQDEQSSRQSVFDHHKSLIHWVLSNDGYFHPDAQIALSSRKGFHVVVANGKTIPSGTRIAACPMPLTISVLNALNVEPFSNRGTRFPASFLLGQAGNTESLQAFFLMEQLVLGDRSWWASYIRSLPTVQDVADWQFDDEAELTWLEGTNLKVGLATQSDKWRRHYEHGLEQLKRLGWTHAADGSYTWERFRWAATIFGSRSFTSQVLDDTLPADKARLNQHHVNTGPYDLVKLFSDRFGVLLPLLDLLNHKPGVQVEWLARYSFVGLHVLQPYESGQELCNNYGPKDNEGLLLSYAFTIQDNPFDHFVISVKAPPGSPLSEVRKWKKDLRSDPEHRSFIFDYRHPATRAAVSIETSVFSFDLLNSISVLCANEREQGVMQSHQQTLMSRCLPLNSRPCFDNGRIILATLSQLLLECSARVNRLKSTDPAQTNPSIKPTSTKQKNAKTYRDSQLSIVETAAAVCTFVLRAATLDRKDSDVLAEMQQELPSPVFHNLQMLVDHLPARLTRPFELLTVESLQEMLTKSLAAHIQRYVAEFESQLGDQACDRSPKKARMDQSRFALMLSALYSELDRGVQLPHRVKLWLTQLAEWYPLDPESWAYVPAPEDDPPRALMNLLEARATMSPEISKESHTKQWLRADRICWGWNVMEEQTVRVPKSVVRSQEVSSADDDPTVVTLYWEHC